MFLNFLGNGSGFSKTHTGAYFIFNKDIIFIDCSMFNIDKMVELSKDYENIYVYLTHMHSDHCSGIGLFVQYIFYTQHKKLNIRVPLNLLEDTKTLLKITGIPLDICDLAEVKNENKNYNFLPIATQHAEELKDKSFGYFISLNDKNVIYTGDTCNLDDFIPYVKKSKEIYVDVSATYGRVHLKFDDVKDILNEISDYCDVYLMHIDDEYLLKELIKGYKFKIANIK